MHSPGQPALGPPRCAAHRSFSRARPAGAGAGNLLYVSLTPEDFVERLVQEVPEVRPIVEEHLADHDELLLHVLTARVRDCAISAFDQGDRDLAGRIVKVFDVGLREGDQRVENVVSVSFVEDTPLWDPARTAFIDSWPGGLTSEAERQRNWRP